MLSITLPGVMSSTTSTNEDQGANDSFGSMEDMDMSNISESSNNNQLNSQEFTKMAMEMAKKMKPQEIANMREQLKNAPLNLEVILESSSAINC